MTNKRSFCEDLFLEILRRLPLKSLCRFKCVSKPWKSLIQDPSIITKDKSPYKVLINGRNHLEYYSIDGEGKATKLIDRYEKETITSVIYCNDLVAVFMYHSTAQQLRVINLATQELIHIPPPGGKSFGCRDRIGIGFDPLSQNFKLYRADYYNLTDLMVLTLENNPSWKTIKRPHIPLFTTSFLKPIINSKGSLYRFYSDNKILLYSFATEEFSYIDLPSELTNYSRWRKEIIEVDNLLSLIVPLVTLYHEVILGMWMLKDDHSWVSMTKNITLSFEDTEFSGNSKSVGYQFLGRNNDILILVSKTGVAQRYIFEYNILSGKLKRIQATGLPILSQVKNYCIERIV